MSLPIATTELSPQERAQLRWAWKQLEHPSLAARLSHVVGAPIEMGLKLIPRQWNARIQYLVETNIRRTLDLTLATSTQLNAEQFSNGMHKAAVMGSGAVGGFFGPAGLLVDLPITTALMLNAIATIAQRNGEDLSTTEARLACLEVFALGGRSKADDAAETGYYGLRLTLSLHLAGFLDNLLNGVETPVAMKFIQAIAARFGVVVTDKAAAQLTPVVGAIGGATINLLFMQHFQDMASGHFKIRHLERKYGLDTIRAEYEKIQREEDAKRYRHSNLEGW